MAARVQPTTNTKKPSFWDSVVSVCVLQSAKRRTRMAESWVGRGPWQEDGPFPPPPPRPGGPPQCRMAESFWID